MYVYMNGEMLDFGKPETRQDEKKYVLINECI